MAQTVQLKRSALSGKVPGTGSLNLGELALNTYDGKIFFRRSGSTDTVQEVITTNVTNTGSITITGALTAESIRTTLTASFGSLKVNDTLTVNHGETIMSGSALVTNDLTILGAVNARQFNISVISSSVLFESGSSRFGNTLDDTHQFTGSVNVTGSLYLNGTDLAAGGAQGTYVFPNAFDFNVDDPTFGDFNSASLGYNLNFGDVETVGSPIHFVGGLSNLGDTTVIYPTSRSIDFVVDDRYVGSISSQSFYTNTTFTSSLQQGYTWVGNGSGVSYAVATSSIAGALPTGVVSGSSQVVSILNSLNTYTGSNDTTNTAQSTRLTTIESVTGSYETKGRGIVSGSSQITYASISSIPAGIVSGSSQVTPLLPTGTVSGSIQVLGGTGIISSSAQLENATITNLTITNLTTVNETASVLFSSGSNRFGDFGDDIHSFTGSVKISGSITTTGNQTMSGSLEFANGSFINMPWESDTRTIWERYFSGTYFQRISSNGAARQLRLESNGAYGNASIVLDGQSNDTTTATITSDKFIVTGPATFSSNVSVNRLATSANYKFGVSGSAYVNGTNNKGIFITDNATYASVVGLNSAISAYNPLEIRASGTDYQLYLATDGKVGINTNNPTGNLTVKTATNQNIRISQEGGQAGISAVNDAANTFAMLNIDANVLRLQSNSGGNTSIGTATDFGYKLNLNGQPGANGYTAWTNWSDSRLKENITDLVVTNVLDKICAIRPVTYNYNELSGFDEATRERRISGFIAQELMEVFPDMVGTIKRDDIDYYDTNLSNLSLYLVKAIQELKAENDTLKERLTAGGL